MKLKIIFNSMTNDQTNYPYRVKPQEFPGAPVVC